MKKTAAQIANTILWKLAQGPRIARGADVAAVVPRPFTMAADYHGGLPAATSPGTSTPTRMAIGAPAASPVAPAARHRPVNWNAAGMAHAAGRPSQAMIDKWNQQWAARHPGANPGKRMAQPQVAAAPKTPIRANTEMATPRGAYASSKAPSPAASKGLLAAPQATAPQLTEADWAAQAQRSQAAQRRGGASVMRPWEGKPATPTPAPAPAVKGMLPTPGAKYNPAEHAGKPTTGNWSGGLEEAMGRQSEVEQLAARMQEARRGTLSRSF